MVWYGRGGQESTSFITSFLHHPSFVIIFVNRACGRNGVNASVVYLLVTLCKVANCKDSIMEKKDV